MRVDYIPRRVDLGALRGGNYAELLNLVPWKVLASYDVLYFTYFFIVL